MVLFFNMCLYSFKNLFLYDSRANDMPSLIPIRDSEVLRFDGFIKKLGKEAEI